MFRHQAKRAALICELQLEVHAHHKRLDRASDGLSLAFVPTSGDQIRINDEHARLHDIRDAVMHLANEWDVKNPQDGHINVKQRRALLTEAIETSRALAGLNALDEAKQVRLESLVEYLLAKRNCACLEAGESHAWQYSTLGKDFGYAMRACAVAA